MAEIIEDSDTAVKTAARASRLTTRARIATGSAEEGRIRNRFQKRGFVGSHLDAPVSPPHAFLTR